MGWMCPELASLSAWGSSVSPFDSAPMNQLTPHNGSRSPKSVASTKILPEMVLPSESSSDWIAPSLRFAFCTALPSRSVTFDWTSLRSCCSTVSVTLQSAEKGWPGLANPGLKSAAAPRGPTRAYVRYQPRMSSLSTRYDFVLPKVLGEMTSPCSSQRVKPCAVAWPPTLTERSISATRFP